MKHIKKFVGSSKYLTILYRICDNARERMQFSVGNIRHTNGSSIRHHAMLESSVTYIQRHFEDYLQYSQISPQDLHNLRVLEIGHGDNYGVALHFLANGAKHVTCLDKYYSMRDPKVEHAIYTLLRKDLNESLRQRFDQLIDLEKEDIRINPEKLTPVYGVKLEEAVKYFAPNSFDLIISRAVVQYLDLDLAFSVMDQLLAPQGYMAHRIDLRDIGLFSSGGLHPLTFLTIPDPIYHLMASHSPQTNRKRINHYRQKMKELGYSAKILITRVLGREMELQPHPEHLCLDREYTEESLHLLEIIRPQLLRRFRELPDDDLLATGIFLVAQKPMQSQHTSWGRT